MENIHDYSQLDTMNPLRLNFHAIILYIFSIVNKNFKVILSNGLKSIVNNHFKYRAFKYN